MVLTSYAKYHTSVDDIQGFSDQGVDVLVRYIDEDRYRHNIGFQIKSYREIADDLRRPSGTRQLIPLLSQQRTRAQSKHQIDRFYVILCGDGGDAHRNFVRRVKAEFSSLDDTKVITPGQAWAFYNLEQQDVAAYCARVLCEEDYVLRAVREHFNEDADDYRRMIIGWVVSQLEGEYETSLGQLVRFAEGGNETEQIDVEERVAEYLSSLQWDGQAESTDGEKFVLQNYTCNELSALYYDVRVRHGLSGQEAIEYLWRLTD
ncbi:hypothetical protein [Paraburkholderia caribensis]|uniref:hypothetical protein n=1 Tax=Paraburkholderia caribensis TaxID=75105 RepID=UPI00078C71D3|nr:hypothetical protein [Paraburkholderia caribensis]AMV47786.1 hypothetical protein ATN79_44780 [Paraburkholderia caribensis]